MSTWDRHRLDQRLTAALKASGSSFYWGIRLLPKDRRQDLAIVYLFCRAIDDIADGTLTDSDKERALQDWADFFGPEPPASDTLSVPGGLAGLSLGQAVSQVIGARQLNPHLFLDIVRGVQMDLGAGICAPDEDTFHLYCYRVAGCVGLITVSLLDCDSPMAQRFAVDTGHALQITNILRDLHEDAANGRLYLPSPVLDRHAVPQAPPATALATDGIQQVCEEMALRAESAFARALTSYRTLSNADQRRLRPALVMLSSYRLLLSRLQRRGWAAAVLSRRCKISHLRLLVDAVSAWILGR